MDVMGDGWVLFCGSVGAGRRVGLVMMGVFFGFGFFDGYR